MPSRPGGWCAREIVGHLIDSACHNHRRFVTAHFPEATTFDAYQQDAWVRVQQYAGRPWHDLIALRTAYNTHLAHVTATTPDDVAARALATAWGPGEVTLALLMEDYVVHLRHHLDQLRPLLAAM